MNKFVTFALLVIAGLAGIGVYWYVRPHHAPRILSDIVPTRIDVPTVKSPVRNIQTPQF